MLTYYIAGRAGALGIYFFSWHAAIMRRRGLRCGKSEVSASESSAARS